MLGDDTSNDEPIKRFVRQDRTRPDNGAFAAWDMETMSEEGVGGNDFNLAAYWRLALKHRLLILAVFIVALVIGVVVTLLTTPLYTASTTIQIDREAARVLNVDDTAPRKSMLQGEEFFQTQYGLLSSRSLAERVIEAQGSATSDAFLDVMGVALPEAGRGGATARAAERREIVLRTVQKNLGISPVRGSRLVNVSFSSFLALGFQRKSPMLSPKIISSRTLIESLNLLPTHVNSSKI